MGIEYQHPEYVANITAWQFIDDICDAKNIQQYLVELNPHDKSPENVHRNKQYRERAVFYRVGGYTSKGLLGLMFSKAPEIKLPPGLEYLENNCDGAGNSIYQQSQSVAENVIRKSRRALYVSFPRAENGVLSQADVASGNYLSRIDEIDEKSIINWRTTTVGALTKLSLVVISEKTEIIQDDGYSVEYVDQIRELKLDGGIFKIQLWRKNKTTGEYEPHEGEMIPTLANGRPLNEIPLYFVGARNNLPGVDEPNMKDICEINKGHYRNSADYEDNVWFLGQVQPWASGIDQAHLTLLTENKMYIGSRNLFPVPAGERLEFAAAPENPLVRQAMIDKIDMMIGLGAWFIRETGVAKTATESEGDRSTQTSILSLISSNVGEAYTAAIKMCARFMDANEADALYQPAKDFTKPQANAQDIQAIVGAFVQGAIPASDYHAWMVKRGLTEKTMEEFTEEVGKAKMPDLDKSLTSGDV